MKKILCACVGAALGISLPWWVLWMGGWNGERCEVAGLVAGFSIAAGAGAFIFVMTAPWKEEAARG